MNKIFIFLIATFFASNLYAQSTGKNYVKETVYRTENKNVIALFSSDNFENVIYLDGLGRPEQLIEKNASPVDQKNIVKHIEYANNLGQTKDYLPFTVEGKETTGAIGGFTHTTYNADFVSDGLNNTLDYYNTEEYEFTANPFSEVKVKNNLRNDAEEIAAPGQDWAMANGHTTKLDEATNTANEVKLFKATATWNSSAKAYSNTLSNSGYFAANALKKQIVKNENWTSGKNNTVEVFKSIDGKVHLKRAYNDGTAHDTYYVYNQLGQLSFVLTPEAAAKTTQTAEVLNELCFQYNYDANGMLAEKKVPGKKWEYMVYDKAGRLALSGPNLNPFGTGEEGWLFVKYDYLNRPVYKGFYAGHTVDGSNRAAIDNALRNQTVFNEKRQAAATIDGISINYTNQVFPVSGITLLDVSYYDNYDFANAPTTLESVNGVAANPNVKGLLTGAWTRNLTTATEKKGDLTYLVYDNKYRPIRVNIANAQGGYTQVNSTYNFFGNPTQVETLHKKTTSATAVTSIEKFTYNAREYLLKHTQTVNGQTEEVLASYQYDELGKLIRKNVGNTASKPLQKIDYKYNIRGWLKQINNPDDLDENDDNDLFGLTINYNTAENLPASVKKQYNGNISSVVWKTRTDNIKRGYVYGYDHLDRVTEATSLKNNALTSDFQELTDYDKNGNITTMYRTGGAIDGQVVEIDDVQYNYAPNSNKLLSVDDATNHSEGLDDVNKSGDDYAYDSFGNLTVDKNRKITNISYNHLNQPVAITFGTGDKIAFVYDSYGNRIKKTVTQNGTTDVVEYLNGYEYKNNQLQYIATSEGFIKFEGNQFGYVYQYKDHVGNVRLTYQDADKNGVIAPTEILDESNYYPFGLKHGYYNQLANNFSNSLLPNSHFNGQPDLIDLDASLSLMDFRMYDSTLGRFLGIDLLADNFADQSPYHFGYNNPVSFADPAGLSPGDPPLVYQEGGPNSEVDDNGTEWMLINFERQYEYWRPEQTDYPKFYFEIVAPPHSGGGSGGGASSGNSSPKGGNNPRGAKNPIDWERIQEGLEVITEVGSWMEIAGYAGAPFTEGGTLALSLVGEAFQNVGVVGTAVIDIAVYKNYEKAALDISFHLMTAGLGHAIPGAKDSFRYSTGNIILSQF